MIEKIRLNTIALSGFIGDEVITGVSIATTGEAVGHNLEFDRTSLDQLEQLAASKPSGIKSRFTHPDWFHDGLGYYLGRFHNIRVDVSGDKLIGDLNFSKVSHNSPAGDIGKYVLDLAKEDPGAFGISVVVDIKREKVKGAELPVARILNLYAADIVDDPALNPNGLFEMRVADAGQFNSPEAMFAYMHREDLGLSDAQVKKIILGEFTSDEIFKVVTHEDKPKQDVQKFDVILDDDGNIEEVHQIIDEDFKKLFTEKEYQNLMKEGEKQDMEDQVINEKISNLEASVEKLSRSVEDTVVNIGNQPPRGQQLSSGAAGIDLFQSYFDWLFGAPGAKLPPPKLRRADALYRAVTGDIEMWGVFDASRVALAAATTHILADLSVNAMNKVVLDLYTNLTAYRWYELITAVQATDGSLQDMQWLQFGGIGNLPVVAEGAAYTELTVVDTAETSAFTKYGGYVGITDKMIRNSRIDQLQAVPRALTISAIRTRSAALASIFTQAAGVGPTLAQDSVVLFHTVSHGNLATTALSIAAWKAARLECVKQAELGSAKRQVMWPRFLLVPADLYDDALVMFGYGSGPGGYPGTPNNDVNPYAQDRVGDPRPIIVPVPDWTDVNDWAYIVDPKIAPVLCMAYGDNPGGTTHPAPQLYSATDSSSGLLFTNDTLPIKVRDYFAYGVATYRGIGKRNVT